MTQVVFIPYTTIVYSDFSQQTFAKHATRSCGEGKCMSPKKNHSNAEPLGGIFHPKRLRASLVIPWVEAKDENQKHLCFANLILCPKKIHSSAEPLGRIFHPKRLRASLVIPWVEAKDENQNIFASQIWFYAPSKIHSSTELLG